MSGTRRSENKQEGTAAPLSNQPVDAALLHTPQISTRPFTPPGGIPIQKTPSIKEIIEVPSQPAGNTPPPETALIKELSIDNLAGDVPSNPPATTSTPADTPTLPQEHDVVAEPDPAPPLQTSPIQFESAWKQLFEDFLIKFPMIYCPLSDTLPTYQDNIIHIQVINDFLKSELEQKKRAILEYWHQHFDLMVEDIDITVNKDMEIKKIIYTAEDKIQNLEEQNPQLRDFLNIINFKIKE